MARSAINFGVEKIKIVGNLDFLCLEAKKMALYGYKLLQNAERYESLEDAVAPCSLIIGTVHQTRYHRSTPRFSWEIVESVIDRLILEKTAIVFGREDNGLLRDEINLCHFLATIPTPDNMSFNLAHSVTVFLYEIYRSVHSTTGSLLPRKPSQEDYEGFFGLLSETLNSMGFFKGTQKDSVMIQFRDITYRSQLNAADLPLLKAVMYKVLKISERQVPED